MDLTKNCIFSCKSSWEALRYRSYEVDWDKLVWDAAIMPKHAFIFWLAIQDRLSAFDRLVKWGWQGNLLCGFCKNKRESRDHIFFECSFSSRMWQQVVGMFMAAGA